MTITKVSAAESNQAFWGLVEQGQEKRAQSMVTDYLRIRIRESSFFEKLLPAVKIDNSDLTPQMNTQKNVVLVEREPNSPAAVTVPLGTQPVQYFFSGDRFAVYFDRIVTPKFTQDKTVLRSYSMDIRQVITDNAVLDMDAEFDRKMLVACQTIVGAEGSTVPETGVVQNRLIADAFGVTRESLFDMRKILPSTFAKLQTVTVLTNHITIEDVAKHGRDEVGGDLSQDIYQKGFQQKELVGINWVVTNKTELVEDDVFWLFPSPEFIGKSLILDDVTMFIESKGFMIQWFAYTERGATIGNAAAVAKARIAAS